MFAPLRRALLRIPHDANVHRALKSGKSAALPSGYAAIAQWVGSHANAARKQLTDKKDIDEPENAFPKYGSARSRRDIAGELLERQDQRE